MNNNIVAIVGRPNVGKSSLFNRIMKEKISIVHDTPGVTRDRIYGCSEWLMQKFFLIDTGGLTYKKMKLQDEIKIQTSIAIEEADVILFLISYKESITNDDIKISKLLKKTKKRVILVINKYDKIDNQFLEYEYLKLGLGKPLLISSSHGIGIGDLLDTTIKNLSKNITVKDNKKIDFSIIGRPNVGKSSLVNAILKEKRVIVSPIPGTTIDCIDTNFKYKQLDYSVIDTAGIRKKSKIFESIEKYSLIRSIKVIDRSDIVLLLLDGSEEISALDTNIGGLAYNLSIPIILVVNKLDLIKNADKLKIIDNIRKKFKYLNYANIYFVSALNETKINFLLDKISEIYQLLHTRIKTSILNEVFVKAQLLNPSSVFNGGRLKIYYSTQLNSIPPTFNIFVNNKDYMHFSYLRYLENQIRQNFGFEGIPIRLIFKNKSKDD